MPSRPLAKISSCSQANKKKCKQKAVAFLTSFSPASGSEFETSASGIRKTSSNNSSDNSISSISGSRGKSSRSSVGSDSSISSWSKLPLDSSFQQRKERLELPFEFRWARDDQLSTILEESTRNSLVSSHILKTPTPSLLPPPIHILTPPLPQPPPQKQRQTQRPKQPHQQPQPLAQRKPLPQRQPQPLPQPLQQQKQKKANPNVLRKPAPKKPERHLKPTSISKREEIPILKQYIMSERRSSSVSPKPIRPPPRDLDAISRIDASLVFEHFTTSDAWDLGSTLRERLLPIPTPVVINISLANQNQTIFHSVTHSGVMPDNESWVERKRRTVLRWGCSTWFMACKFGGDEKAFRERYALGNKAGDYAIHGGGVPIRVTGVEGVVAVVVVSGLKEDEDHAVIVEVIKELYY